MAYREIMEGQRGSYSYDKWTETRVFFVSDVESQIAAAQAPGILIGDTHPDSDRMFAVNCEVEPLGDEKYRVTFTYETWTAEDWAGAPWNEAPVGSSSTELMEMYLPVDLAGKPFVASNGKLLDPLPPVYMPIHVRSVTKSYPKSNSSLLYSGFAGCVNATTWNGIPARRILCDGVTSSQETWQDQKYERITFSFRIRPNWGSMITDSWQPYILDQGDCEWDGSQWSYAGANESDANTTVRLLNGSGKFLTQQQINAGTVHWTPNSRQSGHKVYNEISFSGLPWA